MAHSSYLLHAALVIAVSIIISPSNSQTISSPCSTSMITSLTPCLNYATGSSSSISIPGSPPAQDCCNSLRSVMVNNMDCFCLILTGNVPFSIPFINPTLPISLPRLCRNSVPLQCKATGVPLPPAGPALFGPTSAPNPVGAPAPSHQSTSTPRAG